MDARRPVLRLWIRSAEVWEGGGGGGYKVVAKLTNIPSLGWMYGGPYCGYGYVLLRFGGGTAAMDTFC